MTTKVDELEAVVAESLGRWLIRRYGPAKWLVFGVEKLNWVESLVDIPSHLPDDAEPIELEDDNGDRVECLGWAAGDGPLDSGEPEVVVLYRSPSGDCDDSLANRSQVEQRSRSSPEARSSREETVTRFAARA